MNQRVLTLDAIGSDRSTHASLDQVITRDAINNECHRIPCDTIKQHGRRTTRLRRRWTIMALSHFSLYTILKFPHACATSAQPRSLQDGVTTGSSVDTESCYANLNASDLNSDGVLSQSEFLNFVQTSADGKLDTNQYGMPITEFYLLPAELISIYNLFACGNANYGCPSIPGIDISGISNDGEVTNAQQGIFLFQLCVNTEQTISDVTGTVPETTQPASSASPSMAPNASNNSTTLSPNVTPTTSPITQSLLPTTTTPISTATSPPTLKATTGVPTISPTTSLVTQSILPTTTKPIAITTSPPSLKFTTGVPSKSPTTSPVTQSSLPTTMKPIIASPPPTLKVSTGAPTHPPTTPFPTPIPLCPPLYDAGATYGAGDEVANYGEAGLYSYYRCKPYPMSGWCSQSAYEPGNSLNWEESWTFLGQCLEDEPSTTNMPSSGVISTISPTLTPNKIPTSKPSFSPTVLDENDPPYSGRLNSTFHYGIYISTENVNAQSILTGEDPVNNIMSILVQSTEDFVDDVVASTFGTDEKGVNHSKTGSRRRLSVILEPNSVAIANVEDVQCPDSTLTVPCQNITALVELTLVDEPVQSTSEEFQSAIEDALIDPGLSFPTSSGIFYYLPSSSDNAPSSLELADSSTPTAAPEQKQPGTPSWVVPISICAAIVGSTLLLFLVGKEVQKRKRNGIEYGGSARKEPANEEVYREIMGSSSREGSSGSYPEIRISPKKDISPLDAEIDLEMGGQSRIAQSKSNPFLDSESSSNSGSSVPSDVSSESFTSGSSSSDSSSHNNEVKKEQEKQIDKSAYRAGVEALVGEACPEKLDKVDDLLVEYEGREELLIANLIRMRTERVQAQPILHHMSLNTLNEEGSLSSSEQSLLSSSNSDGKLVDNVAYRAGVEALVKEACPEKLDKVDDLLVEYEGREELLIDNLTRMLTERGQAQPILHYMSLNTLNEEGSLSSSEQSLMSSSNSDGKLVDTSAYRAGVEALVKEACPEKLDKVDDLLVEYEGREELLMANLTRMLANKRNAQDDSTDRRSTATFDDVYDSSYRRSTATFDYDYSSAPGQTPTTTRDGAAAVTDMPPAILEGGDDAESESSSSSVGSSEWSSDDGLSSIDATSVTMSDGRSMSPDTAAAALAAISDASALNSQLENRHLVPTSTVDTNLDNPNGGNQATRTLTEEATQDDLDKAIEAGDWRAVSATAALIANSYPTESTDFDESDHSQLSKSAQNQVEEFDQLVEDGNWDAVIAAATRIESATSDVESLNESWLSSQDESTPNIEGHQQHSDQHADLANKCQEELIAEIKVLVEEVVPDELENLDEMLEQFKGREEDLVTTLRTMQNYREESANAGVFEEDSSFGTDD